MENKGVKKIRPGSAKNRLMLMENTPVLDPLLKKIKPGEVLPEKEKLYEEISKLRLLVNSYKDEVVKHKGRIRQHLQDLNKRDELIMELTGKVEKPGYKKVQVVAELSRRLRLTEMQLEDALADLNDPHGKKTSQKVKDLLKSYEERAENLMKEVESKEDYCKSLTEKIQQLSEEKEGLSEANRELRGRVVELERILKGMVSGEEFEKKMKQKQEEIWEKERIGKEVGEQLVKEKQKNQELMKKNTEIENLNKRGLEQNEKLNRELNGLRGEMERFEKLKIEVGGLRGELEKFEKLKNDVIGLRAELEKYKRVEQDVKNRKESWKVCKEETVCCERLLRYPLGLPEHLQHFLFSLQLNKIHLGELNKRLFKENTRFDFNGVCNILKAQNFVFTEKKDVFEKVVKEFMGKDSFVTDKELIDNINRKLGNWVIYQKDDQIRLELTFLRIVSVKYQELLEECARFDKYNTGKIEDFEFFTSLLMAGIYLHSELIGYICLLFYSIDNEIKQIPYKSFLLGYLGNLSRLEKDDSEQLSKFYMQKIVNQAKNMKIRIFKEFIPDKKNKIFIENFKIGCKALKILIEDPIVEVILKHYGKDKNKKIYIKKKKLLEIIKKLGYSKKGYSSSSSSSKKKIRPKEIMKVVEVNEEVLIRNTSIQEYEKKKDDSSSSSSKKKKKIYASKTEDKKTSPVLIEKNREKFGAKSDLPALLENKTEKIDIQRKMSNPKFENVLNSQIITKKDSDEKNLKYKKSKDSSDSSKKVKKIRDSSDSSNKSSKNKDSSESSKKPQKVKDFEITAFVNPISISSVFHDDKLGEHPQSNRYRSEEENEEFKKTSTVFAVTQVHEDKTINRENLTGQDHRIDKDDEKSNKSNKKSDKISKEAEKSGKQSEKISKNSEKNRKKSKDSSEISEKKQKSSENSDEPYEDSSFSEISSKGKNSISQSNSSFPSKPSAIKNSTDSQHFPNLPQEKVLSSPSSKHLITNTDIQKSIPQNIAETHIEELKKPIPAQAPKKNSSDNSSSSPSKHEKTGKNNKSDKSIKSGSHSSDDYSSDDSDSYISSTSSFKSSFIESPSGSSSLSSSSSKKPPKK